jgi:HlyD family secretion protein
MVDEELPAGARGEEVRQAAARQREAAASAALVVAGARVEDLKAAEAAVMAAQGRLDQTEVLVAELTVKSPVAARVDTLDLRPGDLLAPNAAAARLVEDDALYVRIYVPETQLGHIAVGQEVPIAVDTWKDRRFKGKVEHISAVGEFSPRNLQTADERADQVFAARIGIVDGREQLRAGMAAAIEVAK